MRRMWVLLLANRLLISMYLSKSATLLLRRKEMELLKLWIKLVIVISRQGSGLLINLTTTYW